MDKIRDSLFQRVDNYGVNFDGFYKQFAGKVNHFLSDSIQMIVK